MRNALTCRLVRVFFLGYHFLFSFSFFFIFLIHLLCVSYTFLYSSMHDLSTLFIYNNSSIKRDSFKLSVSLVLLSLFSYLFFLSSLSISVSLSLLSLRPIYLCPFLMLRIPLSLLSYIKCCIHSQTYLSWFVSCRCLIGGWVLLMELFFSSKSPFSVVPHGHLGSLLLSSVVFGFLL